jgi:RNA polymerase sigma-70 factor, ECF subfamily
VETNDNELVESYLQGDESSLKTLIDRYTSPVYNFIFRLCGENDCADLTQETFIKVWKNLKKFDQGASFKAWLFSIARNTSIDFLRKKRSVLFSDFDNNENFEQSLPDNGPSVEEISTLAEDKKILDEAISKLPFHYRTVLLLHYVEGFTFKEIGEILDKPLNTVKSHHHRALAELKAALTSLLHQK